MSNLFFAMKLKIPCYKTQFQIEKRLYYMQEKDGIVKDIIDNKWIVENQVVNFSV